MEAANRPRVMCSRCGMGVDTQIVRYLHAPDDEDLADQLLTGQIGGARCERCGHHWDASVPMIYHDPPRKLVVYVADADRTSLIEEFHAFLEELDGKIPEAQFDQILRSPYQIVIGFGGLRQLIRAVDEGAPFLDSVPSLPRPWKVINADAQAHVLLEVARQYALLGHPREAYAVLVRGSPMFPPDGDSMLLKEWGGHAFGAGEYAAAEAALVKAEALREAQVHRWAAVVALKPTNEVIPEVIPPKLLWAQGEEELHDEAQAIGIPDDAMEATRIGRLLGELDRAYVYLGPIGHIPFWRDNLPWTFDLWCGREERNPPALIQACQVERARAWPTSMDGLTAEQLVRLAVVLADGGEQAKAEDVLFQATRCGSPDVAGQAHLQLGKLLEPRDLDAALHEFEGAAACPVVHTASEALAILVTHLPPGQGNDTKLRETLERIVQLGDPKYGPRALLLLARFEASVDRAEVANNYLSDLAEWGEPGIKEEAALNLGILRAKSGDLVGAREALTIAARSGDEEVAREAQRVLALVTALRRFQE